MKQIVRLIHIYLKHANLYYLHSCFFNSTANINALVYLAHYLSTETPHV